MSRTSRVDPYLRIVRGCSTATGVCHVTTHEVSCRRGLRVHAGRDAWVGGGESISYWEDATNPDLLWSLQETVGHRNVFAVEQASYGP